MHKDRRGNLPEGSLWEEGCKFKCAAVPRGNTLAQEIDACNVKWMHLNEDPDVINNNKLAAVKCFDGQPDNHVGVEVPGIIGLLCSFLICTT